MRCDYCGDESPPDADFCIECGKSLMVVVGKATLPVDALCPDCYASNPDDAWNCRNCGRRLMVDPTPALQPILATDQGHEDQRAIGEGLYWLFELLALIIELIGCL